MMKGKQAMRSGRIPFLVFLILFLKSSATIAAGEPIDLAKYVTVPYPKLKVTSQWLVDHPELPIPEILHGKTISIITHKDGITYVSDPKNKIYTIEGTVEGNYSYYEDVCIYQECILDNYFLHSGVRPEYDYSSFIEERGYPSDLEGLKGFLYNINNFLDPETPENYRKYLHISFMRLIEKTKVLEKSSDIIAMLFDDDMDDHELFSHFDYFKKNTLCPLWEEIVLTDNFTEKENGRIINVWEYGSLRKRLADTAKNKDVTSDEKKRMYERLLDESKGVPIVYPTCYYCEGFSSEPLILKRSGFSRLLAGDPAGAIEEFERMVTEYPNLDFDIIIDDWESSCGVTDSDMKFKSGPYGLIYQAEVYSEYSFDNKTNTWINNPDIDKQVEAYYRLMEHFGFSSYSCHHDGCLMFYPYAQSEMTRILDAYDDIDKLEYWVTETVNMLEEQYLDIEDINGDRRRYAEAMFPRKIAYEMQLLLSQKYQAHEEYDEALQLLREMADESKSNYPVYCDTCLYCCSCHYFQLAALCEMIEIYKITDESGTKVPILTTELRTELERLQKNDMNIDEYTFESRCVPNIDVFSEYLESYERICPRLDNEKYYWE